MVKGASGNLQKEKIINKRKHAGRRPIGIKYFEARMVYRLQNVAWNAVFSTYMRHKTLFFEAMSHKTKVYPISYDICHLKSSILPGKKCECRMKSGN